MGQDSYRFAYDTYAALNNAGKLLGMELHPCGVNQLCGAYYLTGEPHPTRKDKVKVFISKGSVWIKEEGGKCVSLPQWLMEFGGAEDFASALKMIKGESQALHWSGSSRPLRRGEVKYVDPGVLKAARSWDLERCPLFRWMCGMFPKDRVREVWERYNVTTDYEGRAVFWYVDKDGRVLHDKRMWYREDGHRDKEKHPGREYRVADGYSGKCYFGECVPGDGKKVLICESEKSTLLGNLYYDRRFMATGGKSNLYKVDTDMVLVPDMDAREEWGRKGEVWPWWEKWGIGEDAIEENSDLGDMIVWRMH